VEIKYRIANADDLDEICSLVAGAVDTMIKQHIFQWDELYPTREVFQEDIEKKQLYVGLIEKQIAVIYVLNQEYDEHYENGDWQYKNEVFYIIHRLCVNPIFQNKGIAQNTLSHIEEELVDRGVHNIRLDVYSENPYALKLYNNFGYKKTGHADWRKGRFYLMEKHF